MAIFGPPPVSGLGSAGGFKIIIEDRGDLGLDEAAKADRQRSSTTAKKDPTRLDGNLFTRVPRPTRRSCTWTSTATSARRMGVNPSDVFNTLQIYLGSLYVNDFNRFGRTWQVVVQAEGEFRDDPEKVKLLKVRNADGRHGAAGRRRSTSREIGGPLNIGRYNMYPAAAIIGDTKPGVVSGEGIEEMERLCRREPAARRWPTSGPRSTTCRSTPPRTSGTT